MSKIRFNAIKGLAVSASALALVTAGAASAQDQDNEPAEENVCEYDETGQPTGISVQDPNCEVDTVAPQADGQATGNQIVVTGSRIVRDDTYSSISPLQVLDTQTLQDTGQFDAAQILQESESAAGTQIDATFQGFVLNNGPGSQTLDLRGLGADRTLLLLNGRRLAPAGVEGAPTNPSINLIPSSLVARYDLLLDGASSVYGSDAVAGVGNIVLRRDIDGIELFASGNLNEQGGGDDYTLSAAFGQVGDNWNFGIGAEYARRDEIQIRDRDFLAGCNTNLEIDQDGNLFTVGVADNAAVQRDSNGTVSVSESPCKVEGISGRIFNGFTRGGSIYFQPDGSGNIPGFPSFSDSSLGLSAAERARRGVTAVQLDLNGDGIRDVDFQDVNQNAAETDITFISPQDLYNVMAYGEYSFGGDFNVTPFFEANYSRAEVSVANNGTPQIFPYVPALNPFNPCNFQTNPDGIDCRAADNRIEALAGTGNPPLSTGFSLPVIPIVGIRGDRNNVETVQEQYRGVFGVKGDLPFIDFGPGNDWTFEVAGVYSRSEGTSVRRGIREDKLAFALGIDPTADFDGDGVIDNNGDGIADDYDFNLALGGIFGGPTLTPCDASALANPDAALGDLTSGCVPVNLFAPSVLTGAVGDFATQAERDYVFGVRSFETTYEQTLISAYVQGSVFELPGGTAKVVLGGEYRNDAIDSVPNDVASNGLFFGFFADRGAVGDKDIFEAFGEIDLPLVRGETLAEDVRVNLSGRITEDEFYGTNGTYSIKLGWRPFEPLLLKLSYGTSFRSPNLRELFLAGQSGFTGVFDPCAVPDEAFVPGGGFNAASDTRDPQVLENCRREGRDPTRVGIDNQGLNTTQTSSVEVVSGGSLDLEPETSDSFTTGFAFAEAFGPIDFAFNFNYYNISLKGAVTEPSAGFIVSECFNRQDGVRSAFCDRISFDTAPTSRFLISNVFAGFLNFDEEKVEGIDLNANFSADVAAFGKDIAVGLNVRANHLIERSSTFLTDDGSVDFDDDAGEFGFPSWTGRATFSARVDNLTFTFQTRYIGSVSQQADGIDEFSDAFGFGPDGEQTGFFSDTCLGSGSRFTAGPNAGELDGVVAGDGRFCRDVGFADDYFVSNASIRVDFDWFDVRLGVSNIFDRKPPLIDTNEVFGISNTPIGNGYDLNGREYFGSVSVRF